MSTQLTRLLAQPFARSLSVAALLAGAAAGAHAEGFYVGGALSAPQYSSQINGYGDGASGRGPGFKFYGGYDLTPHFAVEAGVFNLGRTRKTDEGTGMVYGEFLDAVGKYEFAPKWTALGSLGVVQARLTTPTDNASSPGLKLSLGVQYALTTHTALRLGYDRYHFVSAFGEKPNVGQTVFGVDYHF
jgi:OOP family OmpA-OmpF porin